MSPTQRSQSDRGKQRETTLEGIFYEITEKCGLVIQEEKPDTLSNFLFFVLFFTILKKQKKKKIGKEAAIFRRNVVNELQSHQNYPKVVEEFLESFQEHISDPIRFRMSLLSVGQESGIRFIFFVLIFFISIHKTLILK